MFAIRITKSFNDLKEFFPKLDLVTERYVWYEHAVPNNIHVHGLVVGCTVSTDTLKNYIRKSVGNMKSTEWSFKSADDLNFITYMAKGNLFPVIVKGFASEEISDLTSKWVDQPVRLNRNQMIQYKLKFENPQQAKMRQNDMIDAIILRINEKAINDPEKVLEEIRQVVYVEQHTIVGRYKIRDYYDTIMARRRPGTWSAMMLQLISHKIS